MDYIIGHTLSLVPESTEVGTRESVRNSRLKSKPGINPLINVSQQAGAGQKRLNEEQFVELYREHFEELHRYACRFLPDSVRAQDAVQESFLRIWKRKGVLEAGPNLRALLYKSVRNLCLNALRDEQTRENLKGEIPRPTETPLPDELASEALMKKQLSLWISELPPRRREVFELSRFNGLSYKEIAEVLGISLKTVENHLLLALRFLRDKLHSYDPKLLQP